MIIYLQTHFQNDIFKELSRKSKNECESYKNSAKSHFEIKKSGK